MRIANVEMAAAWDGDEGDEWALDWERYDRSVRGHHIRLLAAADIVRGERVLDIGCGNGESTRDAARSADPGEALGIDLSSRMIERARSLASAQGIGNVRFEQADAQVYPFEDGFYDVAISRFGAMFFSDPVAAFRNIGRGLRSGGRLALVGWRGLEHNEWLQCIRAALAAGRELPRPPAEAPSPFGLAQPELVRSRLTEAGFGGVKFEPFDETFWLGRDAEDAATFIGNSGVARGLLEGIDGARRATALEELHRTMAEHETADGVVFGSSSWVITGSRV